MFLNETTLQDNSKSFLLRPCAHVPHATNHAPYFMWYQPYAVWTLSHLSSSASVLLCEKGKCLCLILFDIIYKQKKNLFKRCGVLMLKHKVLTWKNMVNVKESKLFASVDRNETVKHWIQLVISIMTRATESFWSFWVCSMVIWTEQNPSVFLSNCPC